MPAPEHRALQSEAIAADGDAQRALMAGDRAAAQERLREAVVLYRRSWEAAPPTAYGRLVGMLKAAVLAGGGEAEATYVRAQLPEPGDSPTAWYALALAALVEQDDERAAEAARHMRAGGEAFERAAAAIAALAARDGAAYADAVGVIVRDFEARTEHLTGVAIADTALALETLAERRGLAARPASSVLPALT